MEGDTEGGWRGPRPCCVTGMRSFHVHSPTSGSQPCVRFCLHPHFTEKETGHTEVRNTSEVTHLVVELGSERV